MPGFARLNAGDVRVGRQLANAGTSCGASNSTCRSSRTLLTSTRESKMVEARHDSMSHRASSCPSWDRTRTLLIQSRAQRVCLEDTMSVSGCPPSIGARRLGGQCPDRSGETLVKCLYRVLLDSPEQWSVKKRAQAFYKRFCVAPLQRGSRAVRMVSRISRLLTIEC